MKEFGGANSSIGEYIWEPKVNELHEIIEVLSKAVSQDNSGQEDILYKINQIKALPDAIQYFVTILCEQSISINQRKLAGLTLKNLIIEHHKSLNIQAINYAKNIILKQLTNNNIHNNIHDILGTIITTIIYYYGVANWPQALITLTDCLSNSDDIVFDGGISTLCKVIEDEFSMNGGCDDATMISFCEKQLLPHLFAICGQENSIYRQKQSLSCLMKFVRNNLFAQEALFEQFFPSFWISIGNLAQTNDLQLKKLVVEAMNKTLRFRPEVIFHSANVIFGFMIDCLNSSDYELKQECVDFWPIVINTTPLLPEYEASAMEAIKNNLPRLLTTLVECTVYAEKDYFSMDPSQFGDNASSPDYANDLQPRFSQFDNDLSPEDDDEEEEQYNHTWGMQWTLRKGSAMSLDVLSNSFSMEVLQVVLPLVEQNFGHKNWEKRESAVLTLGAIAIGTMNGLSPYIPDVLNHLLLLCDDRVPLIRSITCWCISRFSPWICNTQNHTQWLEIILKKILSSLLDNNKSVQEAACSAFATIEDEAREYLIPYLAPITNTLKQAFSLYQAKNLMILYDAIGTLAESVSFALKEDNFGVILMEPLLRKWINLVEHEPVVVAICECLTCLARALQEQFHPYALIIIQQSIDRIQKSINQIDGYHSQVVGCSLNLLSAITEALQQQMCDLLTNRPNNNFIALLCVCCNSHFSTILQSAFALVGDLTRYCIHHLKPYFNNIIPALSKNLIHNATSVSNNAGWAIGQIAMYVQAEEIDIYLDVIMEKLVELLHKTGLHKSLLQNACITIGRLGIISPKRMSTILPQILRHWCIIMRSARVDDEKRLAFQGICNMIMEHPSAAAECLPDFCEAIVSSQMHSEQTQHPFKIILNGIREYYPDHWNQMWTEISPNVKNELKTHFNL